MLCVSITASTLPLAREQQDTFLAALGEDAVAPILWEIYVAIRTPPTCCVWSSRLLPQLDGRDWVEVHITDDPVYEMTERARR